MPVRKQLLHYVADGIILMANHNVRRCDVHVDASDVVTLSWIIGFANGSGKTKTLNLDKAIILADIPNSQTQPSNQIRGQIGLLRRYS